MPRPHLPWNSSLFPRLLSRLVPPNPPSSPFFAVPLARAIASSSFGTRTCCPSGRIFPDPSSAASQFPVHVPRRGFLGCTDGEESAVLSKIHEERRVMGYSPEQMYAVVAAVDMYEDFVPWCQRSRLLRHYNDGSFDAELEIGFKFLVESYISHVELAKNKYIKTTASQSNLFDHLINVWEFKPGPAQGTCDLYFLVDFKFQSPLYRQVASMFFKEVVSRLVSSFCDRCAKIYGPAIPVLENTYGQGR